MKSWTTGALDKAVRRGSIAFTLVLHHLSTFIFGNFTGEKISLRNKLAKSILRDYSRKQQHEVDNFLVAFDLILNWHMNMYLFNVFFYVHEDVQHIVCMCEIRKCRYFRF